MQLDDGPDAGAIPERSELNNVVASATQMQVRQADLVVTAVRVLRAAAPYDELSSVFFGEADPLRGLRVEHRRGHRAQRAGRLLHV